jgi:ABC-2 type transport system permease protein
MKKINKYFSIFKVSVRDRLAYPLELLYANIFILLITFVMSQIWVVVFASSPEKLIAGFSFEAMVWYVFMTELILTSQPNIIFTIGEDIKSGNVAYALTKPYSFMAYYFYFSFGRTIVTLFIKVLFGVAILSWFVFLPNVSLLSILATVIAVILALILNFVIAGSLSLFAFWLEDVRSMRFIYQKIVFIFGGLLFPIDIYPEFLRKIIHYLPFEGILYGPAKTLVNFDLAYWQILVGKQIVWILVFLIIIKIIYARGIKKINLNGG